MAILTPAELTFSGTEIKELNEAVFESVYQKPELSMFHNIVNGIKAKDQIALLGRINGLTGKGSGDCDPTDDANTISMSEKLWDPATVSNSLPSCWKDLLATFFIYGTNNGIAKADLTKTDFFNFLVERLSDALIEEVFRIVWFSDTAAAVTPAGDLTAGTDVAYFDKIEGLWKQLFAIAAATPARLTTDLAAKNGQASFALQEFDSTDTTNKVVSNALQNMRFGSDFRLRGKEGLMYVVTQSVADQYERELLASNIAFTTERMENGIQVLKSGGIEVISFQFWDRIIREWYSDGTVYLLPHRAVLMVKENTQIGTEDEANFSELDVFFDKKSAKNYVRTQYDIDAKIVEDYLVQVAY